MDEIYVYLKSKLDEMRKDKKDTVEMDFQKWQNSIRLYVS